MRAGSRQVAGYPTRRQELSFGALHVQLQTVSRLEDYVDSEELLRNPNAPEPPYWAHLWPGSRVLARLLATEIECRNCRVIDIGCGLGLVGVVAARRGAAVTLIDTAPAALHFARANIALNGCRASVLQTDVRRPGLRGRFDFCLAADVTYDPALQTAVADFLANHLTDGGRAWCAESVRTIDQAFRQACERAGLHVSERNVREPDDGRDAVVRITEVRRVR